MRITISFDSGLRLEGIVLSASEGSLRVAIKDWEDTAEFHFHGGRWVSEFGVPVNVDSLLVSSPSGWRVMTAGLGEMEEALVN